MQDRNLLQITLAELQMKMQKWTAEYYTVMSITISATLVIGFTSFGWALDKDDAFYIILGLFAVLLLLGVALVLNRYYSKRIGELEQRIEKLKKQHTL